MTFPIKFAVANPLFNKCNSGISDLGLCLNLL